MSRKKHRPTGEAAWDLAFQETDHTPLLKAFGVDIPIDILKLALTHRSFANENGNLPNNERLEFLGDAVLGLSVASALYHGYPARAESDISKMRASIVSRYGLADIARDIDLGQYILLGRGELVTGGREKDSILADTTEALLGAIYLTHGFHTARDVIQRLFGDKLKHATAVSVNTDFKTALQERSAEHKFGAPDYQWTATGPDHDQSFSAQVSLHGIKIGEGTGANKKTAEQQAARQALEALNDPETLRQIVASTVYST